MAQTRPKRPVVHRICAVCGKRHGATYGFKTLLRRYGVTGDKAVPACVMGLAKNNPKPMRNADDD